MHLNSSRFLGEVSALHPEPVGELDEDAVVLAGVMAEGRPVIVAVEAEVEEGAGPQDVADEKAAEDLFVEMIVVKDRPERKLF
jgi:hypothetical protein